MTRHKHGSSTSEVSGQLDVCSAADTGADWWQKCHGSWTATAKQSTSKNLTVTAMNIFDDY